MLKGLAILACLPLGGCITIDLNILSMEEIEALPTPDVDMRVQESGVASSLRGVYALDENSCWASGSAGTCLRTTDGGETWERLEVPNAAELDFRDVHPFDDQNALLMTAGTPARIYRTSDGGAHWTIVHEDHREGAFFDGMDFWDEHRGVLFGDPIDGVFTILLTEDGGRTWREVEKQNIPPAMPGEAGFAASGTCVAAGPNGHAIIGLGGDTGLDTARVLTSDDFGETWSAVDTLLATSASAGVFSVAFFDKKQAIAVGGDYLSPKLPPLLASPYGTSVMCYSFQLGERWYYPLPSQQLVMYRSCVAVGRLDGQDVLLATGWALYFVSSHLADYHWKWLAPIPRTAVEDADDSSQWYQHAASFAPGTSRAWIVGAEGKITRIDLSIPENLPKAERPVPPTAALSGWYLERPTQPTKDRSVAR